MPSHISPPCTQLPPSHSVATGYAVNSDRTYIWAPCQSRDANRSETLFRL